MQAPTREEVDLKLLNHELRMENRMAAMERSLEEISSLLRETQERFRSLQRTVILTGISSVFAVAGLNYALLSSMTAAYDVGKSNGRELAEMSATLRQMQVQLSAIERAQAGAAAAGKK